MAADVRYRKQFCLHVLFVALVISMTSSPGRSQDGTTPMPCSLDVIFVLDHSGSVSDNDQGPQPNWYYVIEFVTNMTSYIWTATSGQSRFAVVSFGSTAAVEFNLGTYMTLSGTLGAVAAVANTGGNTNTTGALRLARLAVIGDMSNRAGVADVVVVVTDGVPSVRYEAAGLSAEAQSIRDLGVRVLGIGVGTAVDEQVMRSIVTFPQTDYFNVSSFDQLSTVFGNLTTCMLSSSSTMSYTSSRTTLYTGSSTTSTPYTGIVVMFRLRPVAPTKKDDLTSLLEPVNQRCVRVTRRI